MFSIADMAVAGAVALLLFGPDQLPKVARRAGQLVRDVQNTSQSFIREMERAADAHDEPLSRPVDLVGADPLPAAPAYQEAPQPAPHELVAWEAALEHPALASKPAGVSEAALVTEPVAVSEPVVGNDAVRKRDGSSSPGQPTP